MAEEDAQKTEEATPRKLARAKERGQTASSQEIKTWGILVAAALIFAIMAPSISLGVHELGRFFIEKPHSISFDFENLRLVFSDLLVELFWILLPLMAALILGAISLTLVQTGLVWAPTKIKPELTKISLIKGAQRLVSARAFVEFVKGILKLLSVTLVAFGITIPLLDDLALIPSMDLSTSMDRIHELIIYLAIGTIIVMTIISMFDFIFQKYQFLQQMRMTKQEVRDEHKQSEGDPQVKARIRQLRTERARQRMMSAVPDADVVITNPTHFAVALKYNMEAMQAPRLVAKGLDHLALKIREIAYENDIPVVENPPLARTLYAAVELDDEIPTEHYQAVAEVIGYVMRLKGQNFDQAK